LLLAVATLLATWAVPATADTIRIGGTGGALALMTELSKPFTQQTGVTVDVVPSLGSGGGNKAVADGVLDISVTGRDLSKEELEHGLAEAMTIRTPFVFATSKRSPISMTEREIVAVYSSVSPVWRDGTPIKIILRPLAEDDNTVITSLFPDVRAAMEHARSRAELPIATTDQDNASLAESIRGSFIGATYTQLTMEKRDLRLIAINGVEPGVSALESGRYRYGKTLHINYSRQHKKPGTDRFLQFLASDEGGRALRQDGCLPASRSEQ
jgi:phosphate transport system substrate-binding protein